MSCELSDKVQYPFFYQMIPNQDLQLLGIVQLLLYFQWTWTGLLVLDNSKGDTFLEAVTPMFTSNGICTAFILRIPYMKFGSYDVQLKEQIETLTQGTVNVIIIYGDSQSCLHVSSIPCGKVWISTAQWNFATEFISDKFHGSLSITVHSKEVLGFRTFLQNFHLDERDCIMQRLWGMIFRCWNTVCHSRYKMVCCPRCSGLENLEMLPANVFEMEMSIYSYSLYNAMYMVAHALHSMYFSSSRFKAVGNGEKLNMWDVESWKVIAFFK